MRRATREPTALRTPHHIFLSTLSLRRATSPAAGKRAGCYHFYPRSPCGERHGFAGVLFLIDDFYPRSPCGERQWTPLNSPVRCYFYPRSPCGERHKKLPLKRSKTIFLSTLSLRRATNINSSVNTADKISIHALLAESDSDKLIGSV